MKKIAVMLLAGLLLLSLVACSSGTAAKTTATAATTASETTAAAAAASGSTAAAATASGSTAAAKSINLGLANINEKATFGKLVKMGFENACKAKGWTLTYMDNNSDGAQAVQNAELLVQNKVDFIVDLNVDQSVADTIVGIVGDAKIPMLAVDIAMGDTPFFGCNSQAMGELSGTYASKWIKENWNGELDYAVFFTAIASGDEVQKRCRAAGDVLKADGIKIGETVEIEAQNDTAVAQQRFADFLTAHPDAKKIACFTINENPATGALAAAITANRADNMRIFSCGVGSQFVDTLYEAKGDTSWISSVAVFPEKYGEQICKIVENYESGTPLAAVTDCEMASVDWTNISQYYPEDNLPWEKLS